MTRLQELRQAVSDALMPQVQRHRQTRIELGWSCSACGGDLDDFTHGCKACADRARRTEQNVSRDGRTGKLSTYGNQWNRDLAVAHRRESRTRDGLRIDGHKKGNAGNFGMRN